MPGDLELSEFAGSHLVTYGPGREQRNAHTALDHPFNKVSVIRFERQIRPRADLGEKLIGRAANRSAALQQDQFLSLNLSDRRHRFLCKFMLFAYYQDQFVFKEPRD